MADWLEGELSCALRPAAAPPQLWARVNGADAVALRVRNPWPAWRVAAALVLMLIAGALWFAARGQSIQYAAVELRSSDPDEIRAWVRERTGTDLSVPAEASAHLLGARLVGRTVVLYEAAGFDRRLLIARADARSDGGCVLCHSSL